MDYDEGAPAPEREKPARDGARNRPNFKANDSGNIAEPTGFHKEFAESLTAPTTAFRDIPELDDLARAVKVCVTKSENMADTARQKIATVSPALDAGDFGDWTTQQWLLLKVGLDAEKVPVYLPKPRPASKPNHATVATPREPAVASPKPAGGKFGWLGRRPPVACNLKDGAVCGYSACAAIGCCQVALGGGAAMTGAPIDDSAASDFLARVHKGITTGSVHRPEATSVERRST